MRILVINCGSSTLKFQLLTSDQPATTSGGLTTLAHGIVDRIGESARLAFFSRKGGALEETAAVADHEDAARKVLGWLSSTPEAKSEGPSVVGHRVVHGGQRFSEPTLIDDGVLQGLENVSSLAPLHNAPALSAIRSCRQVLGRDVPQVAVFDTSFHSTMPRRASRYAVPRELAEKHGIRRFGFHGLAHRYMTERYAAVTSTPLEHVKIITLQLGNGCSAAAVAGGRSVDTSMGFTPLEGLMMGTRCGDADVSLVGFLAGREGVDVAEVEDWLNTRSGLLGVSGISGDVRALLSAERQGDAGAAHALDMFCYRVRKYIGAYLAVLGGADAVVFGGGIGENSPDVRARVCAGMSWCGITLDPHRNEAAVGSQAVISADDAATGVHVIPVEEAVIIAQDAMRCLRASEQGP